MILCKRYFIKEHFVSCDQPLINFIFIIIIFNVDHKCKMSAFGKEYDVGAEVVMECKTYKCVKTIDAATFVQIGESK